MNESETAWVAGIIEGEGSFTVGAHGQRKIHVSSTDQDIIERLHAITGVGTVTGPRIRNPKHKPQWIWVVANKEAIAALIPLLLPWLGERRTGKAEALLVTALRSDPRRVPKTVCPTGHDLTIAGSVYIYESGQRVCKICVKDAQKTRDLVRRSRIRGRPRMP